MKRKKFIAIPSPLTHAKELCSYCGKKTMVKERELYLGMEVWECSQCRLLERYKI